MSTQAAPAARSHDPKVDGCGASLTAIDQFAEQVGKKFGIYLDRGRADVQQLVNRLGGVVTISDKPESLIVRDDGDFTVHIPTQTSGRRDRFTIAHEVGHYLLHYRHFNLATSDEKVQEYQRYGWTQAEREANRFAGALLMPQTDFTNAFREADGNIAALASRFDVSTAAAVFRRDELNLPQ